MITALSLLDLLDGSKTVECRKLFDAENKCESLFFIFSDLFCRGKGEYVLKVSLFDLMASLMTRGKSENICTLETNTFTIYSPKEYPGRLPISNLSLSFLKQGINIQSTKIKRNFYGQDFETLNSTGIRGGCVDLTNVQGTSSGGCVDLSRQVAHPEDSVSEIVHTEQDSLNEKDSSSEVIDLDLESIQHEKVSISGFIN